MLNLQVDQDVRIKRLMTTEVPHLMQIIFKKQNENGQMFVCTWDLQKNIEYSMIELNDMESNKPQHLICKGIKEKHNYIMTKTNSYDLFYLLPFKFIKAEDEFKNI